MDIAPEDISLAGTSVGLHHLDLFATPQNAQIPTAFVSWNYHPPSVVSQCLFSELGHFIRSTIPNLPWNLVLLTIQWLTQRLQPAILITPNWPSAPWFPLALRLTQQPPLLFRQEDLVSEDDHHLIKKNPRWTMLRWNISPNA
ncbi:hypothetical protein RMATCC62417_02119 [Rhizopus microsporus]|nr:hypothetical protein RMATCC62417_02119 [Rhizopus microsporus]